MEILAKNKSTLVLGASPNPSRYAFLAAERLQKNGHSVFALGKRKGQIGGVPIETDKAQLALPKELDTVTLYLNPGLQEEYVDWLLQLKPRRVIFNPGTENAILAHQLSDHGIEPVYACTLVMLATRQY